MLIKEVVKELTGRSMKHVLHWSLLKCGGGGGDGGGGLAGLRRQRLVLTDIKGFAKVEGWFGEILDESTGGEDVKKLFLRIHLRQQRPGKAIYG